MPYKYKPSLYLTLALTIVLSVLIVLSLHTRSNYIELKSSTITKMEKESQTEIELLSKNISSYIESYAVNDYNKIINNIMKSSKYLAIVVKDYNMGEILGDEVYINGKIRDNNKILDYDSSSPKQNKIIKEALFSQDKELISSDGKIIAKLSIYSSAKILNDKLERLLENSFLDFLIIAFILTLTLFTTIYLFIVKPISKISDTLTHQDESGIPMDSLSLDGPKEISRLSRTINFMLGSIKKSRLKIELQNKEIINERDKFELAVDGTEDGLWDWDMKNDLISFSNRFYKMLGYNKGDILHTSSGWNELVHPEDLEKSNENIKSYLSSKGAKNFESTFRIHKKEGNYIWVTSRGKALFDSYGNPVRFVGFITDITKQVQHNKELDYTAKHDILTDLPNRFLFNQQIDSLLDKTKKEKTHLALLYIDLDGFKDINDKFGHEFGDSLLIKVSQNIKKQLRKEDFVARLGGDEFVVAISNLDTTNKIVPFLNNFLNNIRQNVKNPKNEQETLLLQASIGVTFYPQNNDIGPEALLRQADQAMYDAKNLGKNQYHIFNLDTDSTSKENLQIIQDFEQSLKNDDFVLYYQPKVDMRTNTILAFETLLRWKHPKNGLMFPDEFLPQVNSHKTLMLGLGKWVISNAFKQFCEWKKAGYEFGLSINISAHEFKEASTFKLLTELLEKHPNIKPHEIEFEILETHAFDDITQADKMISTFQDLGFKIALDDFGTGYSTLTYLKDLSINTLKIDKSFVMDMLDDRASLSILEATIGLADAFGCDVIAEGVESIEHGNILIQLGCYKAQGYVLSKPMPSYEVQAWIASYKGDPSWEETSKKFFNDNSSLYAIVEHREWVKKLQNHLEDPKKHPFVPELNYKKCDFFKWIDTHAKKHFSNKVINNLQTLHIKIHDLASKTIGSNKQTKDEYLNEILKLNAEIVEIIEAQNKM